MTVIFLKKISKIFSLWNRTRKELLFIAVLIVLLLHYAFLNDSMNFERTEDVLDTVLRYKRRPHAVSSGICVVPKLDPFAKSVTNYEPPIKITCEGENWVRCYDSKCNQTDVIPEKYLSPTCEFKDILPSNDKNNLTLGMASLIRHNETYTLNQSDYVKISCKGVDLTVGKVVHWSGYAMALRPVPSPPARKDSINVLVLAFDTLSANGFQRLMPNSWNALRKNLRATVMKGYSTIGNGIASALVPILTGKTEYELLDETKENPYILDTVQLLYRNLKERGYRTAFFEDIHSEGTFLDRLGVKDQPADHNFNKSILGDGNGDGDVVDAKSYCIGDTTETKLILNATKQFMDLDGNRFGFTYVADITQNDFSMVQSADEDVEDLLLAIQRHDEDTLLVVVGDHGPRTRVGDAWQGKLEERLPLLAIALPRKLMLKRRLAALALADNSNTITTPYDLHATLADVLGMNETGLKRGLTLLESIPKNRSCSDAGVEPHWCFCLHWEPVATSDPMFRRTADALVQFVNSLLKEVGSKCASRNLTSIEWVMRQIIPSGEASNQENNPNYQIMVVLQPDLAAYEATMLYDQKEDRFVIKARHITRTNYGNYVPPCVAESHPHLTPFCRCEY